MSSEGIHPDQEVVYTVEIRRPFETLPPSDGTDADAICEFERELLDRLPGWKLRVFARGLYRPPTDEVAMELDLLVLQLRRGNNHSDRKFRKLMFLVGVLRERLEGGLHGDEGKKAERALGKVRKLLGV